MKSMLQGFVLTTAMFIATAFLFKPCMYCIFHQVFSTNYRYYENHT